jgi:hypothetical protein
MNTTAIATIAAELAKLTPQEHLIASELAQKLRVGDKPTQESEPVFDWSIGDRLARLQAYINDPTIRSPDQHKREKERIAKELGCKDVKVVTNKIGKLRKDTQ